MHSLRTRFLLIASGIIVFLGFTIGFLIFVKSKSLLQKQLTQRGITILQCLASHNVDMLLANDIQGLKSLFEDIKRNHKEIAYIYIVDSKGEVVVHTFKGKFPENLLNIHSVDRSKDFDIHLLQKTEKGTIRHMYTPILQGDAGYVHIGMWEKYIYQEISLLLKHIIFVIALVLVGSIVLAHVSVWRIVIEPISRIVKGTQRVGQGDFAHRVAIKRKDEIGQLGHAFNTMTADLAHYRDELLREQAYSENILKSMNDVLITVDSQCRIKTINEATEKLLGYNAEELQGKSVAELFASEGREQFMEGPRKALAGKEVRDFEIDLVTKSGEHIPIVFNGGPLKDANGNIVGAVGVGRDLRQVKTLIKELQMAKDQLQQYSTSLERKVVERTKKLREKTKQLMKLNRQLQENEVAVLNILEDINEANKELEKTKAYLENLIESSVDAIITTDPNGVLTFFSKGAQEMFGFSAEEVIGNPIFNHFVGGQRVAKKVMGTLSQQGRLQNYEGKFETKDGRIIDISLSASLLREKDGEIIGAVGICKDITERKRAEEKIRRANRVFANLLKTGRQLASTLDFDEVIKKGLESILRLGYDRARLYLLSEDGKYLIGIAQAGKAPEEGFEGVRLDLQTDRYSEKTLTQTKPVLHKLGQLGEEAFKKTPVSEWVDLPLSAGDKVIGKISVDNLVSQRPILQEDLRFLSVYANQVALAIVNARLHSNVKASEEKFRTLFENVQDGIYISTPEGRFIEVNEAFVKMFGYDSKEELMTIDIAKEFYLHEEDRERFKQAMKEKGFVVNYEVDYRKKDGDIVNCLESSYVFRDKEGKIVQYQGVVVDLTEQKRLQRQLMQADKLAALGELISGVAHELNNPLASVLGFSQLLLTEEINDSIRRDVETIIREATRCQKIVQNLLTFARYHKPAKSSVGINDIIESVLELRAYDLRLNNIKVIKEFDSDLPKTVADYHQLQQVFFNLINNAEQAMIEHRRRGTLRVRTERRGNFIRALIIDDGPGIPKKCLPKIFDPFFTTKEVGRGTGLGLSICYGIIQEHGGRIYAESQVGKGATFIVELPIIEEFSLSEKPLATDEKMKIPVPKRILVVDDEDAVVEFVHRTLSKQGHQLEIAQNGHIAWEKMRRKSYDAILLDLKMPKMSGQALFEKIEEVKPRLSQRVIFMTGDIAEVPAHNLHKTGNPWLCKPFTITQLNQALQKIEHLTAARE